MKKYSLLLASRGRVNLLHNLLKSISVTTHDHKSVEVLIGIDNDDVDTNNFAKTYIPEHGLSVSFFSRERTEWLHRDYINWMYQYSTGKYVLVLNDDTELINPDWDELAWYQLEKYLINKPDGIVYGHTEDDTGDNVCCCFPLFSRKAVEAVGWVLPNERKTWGADHDVVKIYSNKKVDRKFHVPEIKIRHLTYFNGSRGRDAISYEVEKVFRSYHVRIDYDLYIDKLYNFIINHPVEKVFVEGKTLTIIHINKHFSNYILAINNILKDKEHFVCVCGINSPNIIKLQQIFYTKIIYNIFDFELDILTMLNETTAKCTNFQANFTKINYINDEVNGKNILINDRKIQSSFYENKITSRIEISSPAMSCLMVSHNKPQYAKHAIESVLNQSWKDFEFIIIDSGVLYDQHYYDFIEDKRVKIFRSDETSRIRVTKAMAPWCFNKYLKEATGELIMYLCDDDILYPNAFETFINCYCENQPYAMYASQDLINIMPDGTYIKTGERRALVKRGIDGPKLDCQVDYLQFCHKRDLLNFIGPEYWSESKQTETHADGIFMDKIGEITEIYPIDIKISQNRRTPISTYEPTNEKT